MWVIILFKRVLILIFSFLLLPVNAFAFENDGISAECAVVIDAASHKVLYEKNAYLKHSMASTTKLMTCLIACESGKLNETVTISGDMLNSAEGTSLYLKAGDRITLLDLVKGAMLESGNDAANAIAFYISGDINSFCALMNKRANEIGMYNTNFVTPSGLDARLHYSSAYDMAILGAYCCNNNALCDVASKVSDTITVNNADRTLYNHNKLLQKSKHFKGFKTGFTKKSGRCLVSAFEYGGSTLITVTLNAPDDWNDHFKLVRFAKKSYNTAENKISLTVNSVGSQQKSVKCCYSYKLKTIGTVTAKLYYYPFVYAPLKAGEVIGKAELYSGETLIETVNIYSQEDLSYG